MKALTLHQPWASLIAWGCKQVETRSWQPYPNQLQPGAAFAIHAGKTVDHAACERPDIRTLLRANGVTDPDDLPTGAVICTVIYRGAKRSEELRRTLSEDELTLGNYADGRYGWLMAVDEVFDRPISARGQQGLWDWQRLTRQPAALDIDETHPIRVMAARALGLLHGFSPEIMIAGSLRRSDKPEDKMKDIEIVAFRTDPLLRATDMLIEQGTATKAEYGEKKLYRWGDSYRGMMLGGYKVELFMYDQHNRGLVQWLRTGPHDGNTTVMWHMVRARHIRSRGGYIWWSPSESWHKPDGKNWHADDAVRLSIPTEADLFSVLGIRYLPPHQRCRHHYDEAFAYAGQVDYAQFLPRITQVANFHHVKHLWDLATQTWHEPGYVYAGRANAHYNLPESPLHNPHTGDDAIELFRTMLDESADTMLLARGNYIKSKALDAIGQTLVCWCAPDACHCDVLVEWLHPGEDISHNRQLLQVIDRGHQTEAFYWRAPWLHSSGRVWVPQGSVYRGEVEWRLLDQDDAETQRYHAKLARGGLDTQNDHDYSLTRWLSRQQACAEREERKLFLISGSRQWSRLSRPVWLHGNTYTDELREIVRFAVLHLAQKVVDRGYQVIVGDAPGVDSYVMEAMARIDPERLTVVGANNTIRNSPHSKSHVYSVAVSYSTRDRHMVDLASAGLFIWNERSKGTLRAYQAMCAAGKVATLLVWDANRQRLVKPISSKLNRT